MIGINIQSGSPKVQVIFGLPFFWRRLLSGLLCKMLLHFSFSSHAQHPDSLEQALPEINILGANLDKTGYANRLLDSLPPTHPLPLAQRLILDNLLFIRANAPGTLATLSARGLGPSHTPVFWQGFNLQSPQNGVVDASLLPVWPGDRVELRYGGQSAALSSGAMGGAVMIESAGRQWQNNTGWHPSVGISAGSFGRFEGRAGLNWSEESFSSETRIGWQLAENHFPYVNTTQIGAPRVRQQNNALRKIDVQHISRIGVGRRRLASLAVWGQSANREIPPAMTEASSTSWQRDQSIRVVGGWQIQNGTRFRLEHKAAYFDESIRFQLMGDVDSSRARTAAWRSELTMALAPNWLFKTGGAFTRQWAIADGYQDSSRWFVRNQIAAYGMLEHGIPHGRLTVLLRQEWFGQESAPFTWSVGGEWRGWRFHLSRNFLMPTFNDRYWRGLGNPALRPESGYSGDLGWRFPKHRHWEGEASVFHALVDELILWQPGVDGIFRPENARKVWSRGAEIRAGYRQSWGAYRFKIHLNWQYTFVTNTAVYAGEEQVLNKQLPYTPQHLAGMQFQQYWKNWTAVYLHQFTDVRFTTTDNASRLPAYQSGTLMLQYLFNAKGHQWAVDFTLENCWNQAYQVIAYRPMPGRNWRAGVYWYW